MRYETTFTEMILKADDQPVLCPSCSASHMHTVYGERGGKGRLRCINGHRFDFPAGMDAYARLEAAINDARRIET